MANELLANAATGLTLYTVLLNSIGQAYNTMTPAFEAINGANWADYDIMLTEAVAGIYLGTMPAVAAGAYSYAVYERAGVNPATTDTLQGTGGLDWSGTAEVAQTGDAYAVVAHADYGNSALNDAIGTIGSGTGAALNFPAETDNTGGALKSVTFVGSQTLTYAATAAEDTSRHAIADSGGSPDIDIVYRFNIGAGRNAAKVVWKGTVSTGDTVTVQAYNGSTWDTRATISATGSTNVTKDIALLATHTGTGTDAGLVHIRFTSTGMTNITLSTDELLVAGVSVGMTTGYADGAVWVKAAGTAGTTPYINGTADNPCPWANALTVAAAVGLTRFRIVNGETVTLLAACDSKSLIGRNWNLALGAQSISASYIEGATVTGIGTGASQPTFVDCRIGAVTICPAIFLRTGIGAASGTFTAGTKGSFEFIDCFSLVGSGGTPTLTFTGLGASSYIQMRRWTAGSTLTLDGDCSCKIDSLGGGVHTVTVGGGTLSVRGTAKGVALTTIAGSTTDINGIFGAISIAGTGGTVTINGVTGVVTDTSTGTTVTQNQVNQTEISDANLTAILEGTLDVGEALRIMLAALAGKSSGGGTAAIKFRNQADDADRITATVDASGNRTAISVNGT